jgi:hypothetical protein
MTLFLNFRSSAVAGPVAGPYLLEGDGAASPPSVAVVDWARVPSIIAGKNLLFVAHGFNVNYQQGAYSLGTLGQHLAFDSPNLFIGILWPGDAWIPVIDYPFEGNVAIECGRRLAEFCETWCAQAQSISFASHSLGARVILEAIADLRGTARLACVTAGAVNRDCFDAEYSGIMDYVREIRCLSSHRDNVLKLAFPIGDPFADLLHDDHTPFRAALGYDGPSTPTPGEVLLPWQISDQQAYAHGDYLPSANAAPPAPGQPPKWTRVSAFVKNAFLNLPQTWP